MQLKQLRWRDLCVGAMLMALVVPASLAGGKGHTACKQTARILKQACKNDVREEVLIASANCINFNDSEVVAECFAQALETRAEENELCGEQKESRIELCELLNETRYDPDVDPANFLSPEETAANPNGYFPLVPGNEWTLEAEDETVVVTVTDRTIEIQGVTCMIVRDVVTEDGEFVEDTDDYFAQDLDGNVWYFGEIARNYEDGVLVDVDGSWRAGVDGAKAGIVMPTAPYAGMVYRQEMLLDDAEDAAEVISTAADESSSFVDCEGACLQTLDFTPIEPETLEFKYYLWGVGPVLEVDLENGERLELVDFTPGS